MHLVCWNKMRILLRFCMTVFFIFPLVTNSLNRVNPLKKLRVQSCWKSQPLILYNLSFKQEDFKMMKNKIQKGIDCFDSVICALDLFNFSVFFF